MKHNISTKFGKVVVGSVYTEPFKDMGNASNSVRIPTTKEQYDLYCSNVIKWMELLGITNYDPVFFWAHSKDCAASVAWQLNGTMVHFYFSREIEQHFIHNEQAIEELALHEVLHLALSELEALINADFPLPTKINFFEEKSHFLISRLSKLLRKVREENI